MNSSKNNIELTVCMITYAMPPDHSGAAKQAITLAKSLRKLGVKIFFVTQGNTLKAMEVSEVEGFSVDRIYKETFFYKLIAPARFFWTLFRERNRISIIHVHGVGYLGKIAVFFGLIFNKPVILKMTMLTEDDGMAIKRSGQTGFWFFSRATKLIAITSSFFDSCLDAGVPLDKIALIPNGVDTLRFTNILLQEKHKARIRLGLPTDKTILVYAGIIRPEKGIDLLLDTMQLIALTRNDISLLLIGPVESWLPLEERLYAEKMLRRMTTSPLSEFVIYIGGAENVHEYFQLADIFVSASKREGFPNVLLEAMASGLASVVINIPGIHDKILENGLDAIVIEERDSEVYAQSIKMIVDDVTYRKEIAYKALEKVRNIYSMESVCSRYLELYSRLDAKSYD